MAGQPSDARVRCAAVPAMWRALALAAAGWVAAACGATTHETVRAAVDEIGKRGTWQKLQEPARGIAGAVVDGVLDALSSEDRRRAIDTAIDSHVEELARAAAAALDQHAGPAIERAVRRAVHGIVEEALGAPVREAAAELTNRIVASALDAAAAETRARLGPALRDVLEHDLGPALRDVLERDLGPALATMLTRDLGPAMQAVLVKNLGPGLRSVIDDDLTPSLANLAERTSAAAVRGAADGADASLHRVVDPRLGRIEAILARGEHDAGSIVYAALAGGLAMLALVLGVLAHWHRRQARGHRHTLHLISDEVDRIRVDPAHAPAVRDLTKLLALADQGSPDVSPRAR